MKDQNRFLILVLIMASVCLLATGVSIWILYHTSIEVERNRLVETAQSQARLIEAVGRFDAQYSRNYPKGSLEATLSQIRDAHGSYKGFGETGEFTLARKQDGVIHFLLSHRHFDMTNPKPVSMKSELAVPMQLALSGKSGSVIARDYRGETVLAAHEPVSFLNMGIVAKIDMAEIRAPYIRAMAIILGAMLGLVVVGAAFFRKISYPIARRLEEQNKSLNREIGERIRTEDALRANEAFLKTLLDAIPAPIFYKGRDGLYLGCNRSLEQFFGFSRDYVVGKSVHEIFPEGIAETYEAKDMELFESGGVQQYQQQLKNARGELRDVSIHKAAFLDKQGYMAGVIGVLNDITELKQAQEAIKNREQLLNEMGSIAKIGGWEHDLTTGKATWTKEVYKIIELDEKQTPPGPDEHLEYYLPGDREKLEKAYNEAIENGLPFDLELQCVNASGKRFWARAMGTPVFQDGKCVKLKGTFQDISERKTVEERLRQAQKMESIGHLAGGIAHDFNNLLFPIVGMAEILMEDLPEGSPEFENAQVIFESGKRGGELVKQILAFSRQTEHKMSPVRIQQVLKEVLNLTRATIPSFIEMEAQIQWDCGMILADATQIHQVAMNIITNAFHAVEQNGGKITVNLKEILIDEEDGEYSAIDSGRYALMSISDNGPGMPSDLINRIFEPYFTTKEQGKGTGLGLAVAYGLIKAHKGDIRVYSEPGKGTAFNVYLPLMEKMEMVDQQAPKEVHPTGDERILLIDDEAPIVKLETQMLQRLGYQVTARTSSLEALEAFQTMPYGFDLIISDMTMPNMTGDQLAEEVIAVRPDIPIIICTGFSERLNEAGAGAKGIKAFLMKPVVRSELAQIVRRVLDAAKPG
ncbi:PAS/PAC sensor hybrid histidine kinase [Desulfatibacillum aliphaticivorans]|uniref:histidine kinase n=1 Tax=Desulfatibacillum aliphaticivorans TaxID=218208 RepID=B8F8X4_DESAL|nr:PAS domain S-box protein [Desulfatibacillum aliphaticivorans]ACL02006.1 PAS/PAC sensor hybrid histidine kinase [Desulfatibacillum aliphaticivorans]